jgi:hypothetical protein
MAAWGLAAALAAASGVQGGKVGDLQPTSPTLQMLPLP